MKFLGSAWGLAILSVLLYGGTMGALMMMSVSTILEIPPPRIITKEKRIAETFDINSDEINQLIAQLKEEKERVAQRDEDLRLLKEQIDAERTELLRVRGEIENIRASINNTILTLDSSERENFAEMVVFYTEMGPDNALKIINQFDDVYLVKVLYLMDLETKLQFFERITGESPVRAKRLLEMLRRFVPPGEGPQPEQQS